MRKDWLIFKLCCRFHVAIRTEQKYLLSGRRAAWIMLRGRAWTQWHIFWLKNAPFGQCAEQLMLYTRNTDGGVGSKHQIFVIVLENTAILT